MLADNVLGIVSQPFGKDQACCDFGKRSISKIFQMADTESQEASGEPPGTSMLFESSGDTPKAAQPVPQMLCNMRANGICTCSQLHFVG